MEDGIDGWSVTRSNLDQTNQISATLDEGLRQGALGVRSTIGYAREGITTYEMFEARKIVAKYGRLTAAHHHFHSSASTPNETATGETELLTNAMVLGASLQLHHAGIEAMDVRVRIQAGMIADITIFGPENVKENNARNIT